MSTWFEKLIPSIMMRSTEPKRAAVPEGLWTKCLGCGAVLYRAELERNTEVCPKCDHHHRIEPRKRLAMILDPGEQSELAADIGPSDHLKFKDAKRYKDRISQAQKATGEKEALIVIEGRVHRLPVVIAAFNFDFMGGSMGSAVGERFVRGVQRAIEKQCGFICFSASGGARMQEGLLSLMQMAKTSAALSRLAKNGLPFISILTDPTMGGVSASFAMLGDIIIAEPKALIGFAGPRVIEQTVRQTLPEGFQRSEFLREHGHIDMIVDRRVLRDKLASLLARLSKKEPIEAV